jgi:hypothetical protein
VVSWYTNKAKPDPITTIAVGVILTPHTNQIYTNTTLLILTVKNKLVIEPLQTRQPMMSISNHAI